MLSYAYGFVHISPGDQIRDLFKHGEAKIREQVMPLLLTGEPMPEELLRSIVLIPMELAYNTARGVILDGVPRNLTQANILDAFLNELDIHTSKAINLHISNDHARKRAMQRLICKNCLAPSGYPGCKMTCDFCETELTRRIDDVSDVMDSRWNEYYYQTEPLMQSYEDKGNLMHVNGERPIHVVFAEVINSLRQDLIRSRFL